MSTGSPAIHEAIACLTRLTEVFAQRRSQLARAEGLTEQQWRVLEEISTEHFMPSMFARDRARTPAAVSKTLRQLADKGLISTRVSKRDGRQRDYGLTAQGRRTLSRLRARREKAIEQVWSTLDTGRIHAFTRFGNQLTERLEQYAQRSNRG